MYDARQIANEFIRRGLDQQDPLSPLHIQKLVYFAHARLLALHGTPLVSQVFRKWDYGPVVRELWDALKSYGSQPVTEVISLREEEQAQVQDSGAIEWCYNTYGHIDPFAVSALTHEPEGPWDKARKNGIIPNERIMDYYSEPWKAEERRFVDRVSKHPALTAEYLKSQEDFENGRYYTASSPEEMLEQIKKRRAERGSEGS